MRMVTVLEPATVRMEGAQTGVQSIQQNLMIRPRLLIQLQSLCDVHRPAEIAQRGVAQRVVQPPVDALGLTRLQIGISI